MPRRVRLLPRLSIVSCLALLGLAACGTGEPIASSPTQSPAPIDKDELAEAFIRFARSPGPETMAEIAFTDEVSLGLGDKLMARRSAEEFVEAGAWVIVAGEAGFRERSGPFSALDLLAQSDRTMASVGSYSSCNAPDRPAPAPAAVADLLRVSIQPDPGALVACTQWWSVDLYITPRRQISAVTLDFGAP